MATGTPTPPDRSDPTALDARTQAAISALRADLDQLQTRIDAAIDARRAALREKRLRQG